MSDFIKKHGFGKCAVSIGATGTGKTTYTKKSIIGNEICFVTDINGEYSEDNFKNVFISSRSEDVLKTLQALQKVRGAFILLEEATIFISRSKNYEELREILVRKRHNAVNVVFHFHSIRKMPIEIMDFCDVMYLRKTRDEPGYIDRRLSESPEIQACWHELKDSPNMYDFREIVLY